MTRAQMIGAIQHRLDQMPKVMTFIQMPREWCEEVIALLRHGGEIAAMNCYRQGSAISGEEQWVHVFSTGRQICQCGARKFDDLNTSHVLHGGEIVRQEEQIHDYGASARESAAGSSAETGAHPTTIDSWGGNQSTPDHTTAVVSAFAGAGKSAIARRK